MKYLSIDIETTGLDNENHQVLEFGAVIRDTDFMDQKWNNVPTFKRILEYDEYIGNAYALQLNQRILKILSGPINDPKYRKNNKIIKPHELGYQFWNWLFENGMIKLDASKLVSTVTEKIARRNKANIIAVGKNFGAFDKQFITRIDMFNDYVTFTSRSGDPATLWLEPNDKELPNLQTCMNRAGMKSNVTHDALQDAIDTAKVYEAGLRNLKQF